MTLIWPEIQTGESSECSTSVGASWARLTEKGINNSSTLMPHSRGKGSMLIRPFISRQSSLNSPRRSWYIAPASSDVPGPMTIRGQPGTSILSSVVAEFEVGMIQRISVAGVLVVSCVLLPSLAWAQQSSGIAGVVRDTSGAVLPGVTVEASSPALIEKVRSVTTDGDGRYNIVDLRPGTYVVTFSLAGFNTFKREGVALTAGFTATINA